MDAFSTYLVNVADYLREKKRKISIFGIGLAVTIGIFGTSIIILIIIGQSHL